MTTLDDIIIKPANGHVFCKKQGSLFWPTTYKYNSSDGLKLRSKKECSWHSLLSREGIRHTYEPNIPGTRYRPDFGVANNFLLEICGMVDFPQHKKEDTAKKAEYKSDMDAKRKEFMKLGYNILEVYSKEVLLNGYILRNITDTSFVLAVVKKYNPGCRS